MTDMAATRTHATPDPTKSFFDRLANEPQPLLANTDGTLRFDILDGTVVECRYVTLDKGAVTVGDTSTPADVVVRLDRALCNDLVSGRRNAVTALLRGDLTVDGDLSLVVVMQRLFPGPPRGATP